MATITKRGAVFQARIRRKDYPQLTATFDTRRDAEIWVREHERAMDRRTHPDTLLARQITLGEVLDDYRLKVTPQHQGAEVEDRRILRMMQHPFAQLTLAELDWVHIEDYIEDRLQEVCGSTVNRELTMLTSALKRARKRKLMHHNPMADADRPRNNPGRKRRLHPSERAAFIKAMKSTKNRLFGPYVVLAEETGIRRYELIRVQWGFVKLADRVIDLPAWITKTNEPRLVPLSKRAVAALRLLRRQTKHHKNVFGDLTVNALKLCWRRVCKRAHIEDFHLHDLRHERVSSLVDAGWDATEAMAVSGHKDMRAFRGYVHPRIGHLIDKLDQL